MSRDKGKVIHVDKLTIHAKEVEIIQERRRDHKRDHERGRRHPFDFFGHGRRERQEFDEDKHIEDESSSVEEREEHRGPRWI